MSKLQCLCGHTIVDQTDNLPYKGYLIPDVELEGITNTLCEAIDSLAEANKQSKRLEWIKKHFVAPPYPTHLADSSMIFDIMSSKVINQKNDVFECEKCGRIAIQVNQTNQFKFYKLED